MKYLVTGGCGFIGSNFIRMVLKEAPGVNIVNLDALTYAGNLKSVADLTDTPNYSFVHGDIADKKLVDELFEQEKFDIVFNFAAESHVDRSIENPGIFLTTNILGTQNLLEASLRHKTERFVQVSTDEVYGSLGPEGKFSEQTPLDPRSPYSASKAAADHLVSAYHHTFKLNAVITRCSNNYGAYQFPEKLIPLTILNAFQDKTIPVYGDGMNVRDWIHVEDHSRGVWKIGLEGKAGCAYNLGGDCELPNLQLVKMILKLTNKPESLIRFVEDRKGHDRRYAMDFSLAKEELGWSPLIPFEKGLEQTVAWYESNREWWEEITNGDYLHYYEKMYAGREVQK